MTSNYYIKEFFIIVLFCLFSASQTGAVDIAKNKTVKIKCTEMSCDGCKKKITKSISYLDGIKKVNIDLETKIITVTFDESKLSIDKIIGAITEAGYESELIE
jgi:copper chaperone CopZ